jgi:hypothetical protein
VVSGKKYAVSVVDFSAGSIGEHRFDCIFGSFRRPSIALKSRQLIQPEYKDEEKE